MLLKASLLTVSTGVFAGCVPYPVYKTLQPSASATVLDENSNPIAAAKVTLIASAYPYGREKFREIKSTDPTGVAVLTVRREWRTEVLAMHGWEEYFWNWCVEKPGFLTFSTSNRSATQFVADPVFQLAPGESKPCTSSYPSAP